MIKNTLFLCPLLVLLFGLICHCSLLFFFYVPEKYLQEIWPNVKRALSDYGVSCELNLVSNRNFLLFLNMQSLSFVQADVLSQKTLVQAPVINSTLNFDVFIYPLEPSELH